MFLTFFHFYFPPNSINMQNGLNEWPCGLKFPGCSLEAEEHVEFWPIALFLFSLLQILSLWGDMSGRLTNRKLAEKQLHRLHFFQIDLVLFWGFWSQTKNNLHALCPSIQSGNIDWKFAEKQLPARMLHRLHSYLIFVTFFILTHFLVCKFYTKKCVNLR